MNPVSGETLPYKRSRFSTRLPLGRLYTPSHYWIEQEGEGLWRVGFTKFAIRMLGDLVEYSFSVKPAQPLEIGQNIGWVEGFKAVSELYSVVKGEFVGTSSKLEEDITLTESDPYGAGWLYRARGTPEPNSVDAHGYAAILDATIDKMLQSRHERGEDT